MIARTTVNTAMTIVAIDRSVQVCEICSLARDSFFEVVNVAADFSTLGPQCGYNVRFDHAPKAGGGRLEILVAVAP
jgi:hypothetical protein